MTSVGHYASSLTHTSAAAVLSSFCTLPTQPLLPLTHNLKLLIVAIDLDLLHFVFGTPALISLSHLFNPLNYLRSLSVTVQTHSV